MPISLASLVTAYRKAKVDLYYSSDPRRLELVEYEERLAERLSALLSRIEGEDEDWVGDRDFLGTFVFAPKRLEEPPTEDRSFWSDPRESWEQRTIARDRRAVAEFRLMSRCSIDLHVLSTLWMLEVGTHLDSRLPDTAYGNRLRRGRNGEPNRLGLGSFLPYQSGYQRWRDTGLAAMTRALSQGREVIALTADVTAFYHRLDPRFLERDDFVRDVLGVDLEEDQAKIHRLFVAALQRWSAMVAESTGWRASGLPVGLPASAVVANLALAGLDSVVEGLAPLSYGRYVDDVLLVLEVTGDLVDQRGLWDWLIARSDGLLTMEPDPSVYTDERSEPAIRFVPWYLEGSSVVFENSKNKTFHLRGRSGMTMIDAIRSQIRERSSEWRAMATLPDEVDAIGPSIASVLRSDGTDAVTLRDADQVSARKQSFSLRVRDLALYERNLPPSEWAEQRREFYRTTCNHVLTLPAFFELSPYLPRLVALAAASADRESLGLLIRAVATLVDDIRRTCSIRVASFSPAASVGAAPSQDPAAELVWDYWVSHLVDVVIDEIASGWRARMTAADWRALVEPLTGLGVTRAGRPPGVTSLRDRHRRMAQRDLAHHPYRWTLLQRPGAESISATEAPDVPFPDELIAGAGLLVRALQVKRGLHGQRSRDLAIPGESTAGIVLATRPPTMMDLHGALGSPALHRYGIAPRRVVQRILLGLRGMYGVATPSVRRRDGWPTVVHAPVRRERRPVRVALAMLRVDVAHATAAAAGRPQLSRERFDAIREFLESVARHSGRPDYLVLPELGLPAVWFAELATGLQRSGVSLISGIEHQPSGRGQVTNQVWAALRVDGPGQRFTLYKQDKQRPARREARLLADLGKTLVPDHPWTQPPVLSHGDFRFALLVCSELTNIGNRAPLRGAIDALIVPEWNQDVHWFEALVESATLDLHTFVAQANTLGYGDTRLRAPMDQPYARDVVRLKGGAHDYMVMGEIDHEWLRRFQTADVAGVAPPAPPTPSAALKPTPDGFRLDPERERS